MGTSYKLEGIFLIILDAQKIRSVLMNDLVSFLYLYWEVVLIIYDLAGFQGKNYTIIFLFAKIFFTSSFDKESKSSLRRIAVGIKVIYSIKITFPEKIRTVLLKALVLSHLHCPIVLFSCLKESFVATLKNNRTSR